MLNSKLITLLLLVIPLQIFSQHKFLEVTVTTNAGSKIKGKMPVETWQESPRSLNFLNDDGSKTLYKVADIQGFEIKRADGSKSVFERWAVNIEVSPKSLTALDNKPDLRFSIDTAWLELEYQGSWKLFHMIGPSNKHHYLIQNGKEAPIDIVLKLWKSEEHQPNLVRRVEYYKKQLSNLAEGCEEAQKMLKSNRMLDKGSFELYRKSLLNFCRAYDKCRGVSSTFNKLREKGGFSSRVIAGWHTANVSIKKIGYEAKNLRSFNAGLGLDYFFSRTKKRMSIQNDLIAYYEKNALTVNYASTFPARVEYKYKSGQIVLSNMFAFRIFKSPFSPSVRAGIAHRYQFGTQFTIKSGFLSSFETAKAQDYSYLRSRYEVGPMLGLASEFNKWGIAINYQITRKAKDGLGEEPDTKLLTIQASYRF